MGSCEVFRTDMQQVCDAGKSKMQICEEDLHVICDG